MTLKEFAQIIKKSGIGGANLKKIIYQLFQAIGAKGAINEPAAMTLGSDQSPSSSTIQNWLGGKMGNPRVSSYFPNLKIENEKGARDFLLNTPQQDQWKNLQALFKEWHDKQQTPDKEFCINIDTDDFDTFYISFWRQFVFYFKPLRLWDGAEEHLSETKDSCENSKRELTNRMINVFRECFICYRVFEFIPKEIKDVIDSLGIYREILDERARPSAQDAAGPDCDIIQGPNKMYCKWFFNNDCFVFCVVARHKAFWELETPEGYVIIKCNEGFTYDMISDTWVLGGFKYVIAESGIFQNEQFADEAFLWKEYQGNIIIFGIDPPIDVEETDPIIEDCYVLIDEMLTHDRFIDDFTTDISEKIIEKYKGLTFDNNTGLLYNNIKQYIKSLLEFKKYLTQFRNLKKEKSQYLSNQSFKKAFDKYSSFPSYEVTPKPIFPFSECYLDPDEADKVQSELCRQHKNLIDLYAEIIRYEGNCTT